MIEAIDYRNAMSMLTTAVSVITTKGPSGIYGFTASAVCSVTDTPPTLLVCMNQSSRSHGHFIENEVLSVNVLRAQQEELSNAFASKLSMEERFKLGDWTELTTGSPILQDALVSFDCKIDQIQIVGTHSVFMCHVVDIHKSEPQSGTNDSSLVYFNRAYHQIR